MGPRLFSRGKLSGRTVACCDMPASMGPRLFGRGNVRVRRPGVDDTAWLQWGRGFSAAEMRQWPRLRAKSAAAVLQWGRGFSAAEIGELPTRRASSACQLQWGRGFSAAEMRGAELPIELATFGFNGAAAFQPRKSHMADQHDRRRSRASMGPRLFGRGNVHARHRRSSRRHGASMGPRLFSRGRAFHLTYSFFKDLVTLTREANRTEWMSPPPHGRHFNHLSQAQSLAFSERSPPFRCHPRRSQT